MPSLNADLSQFAVAHTGEACWQASPSPTVWRKRVYLDGPAEAGRVTSVVRYDAGSRFPAHDHPGGEEILVLDGVFSDEQGDYPAGHFLLNPEGFRHAPFSDAGCTLLVKLRQYPDSVTVHHDTAALDWEPGRVDGVHVKMLYASPDGGVIKRLVRVDAGTGIPSHDHPGGEEVFLIEGDARDERGVYGPGCWARYPAGASHRVTSQGGALLYVQTGGFGANGQAGR